MKKLLKNPSTTDYLHINGDIELYLGPEEIYELTGADKLTWIYDEDILDKIRDGSVLAGDGISSFYTDPIEGEIWFRTEFDETSYISDGATVSEYSGSVVEDTISGKKSTTLFMNMLTLMKELYNDPTNPVYEAGFQKFIGTGGREVEHLARTLNLETIHGKIGWHEREIVTGNYVAPQNLLFYYGWLNSFNSATNLWNNELVAQELSKYDILVFGDGLQNPSHGDYANTTVIIARIKALHPTAKIFGYVATYQSLADFQTKVNQWDTLHIDGIFMDESGYDYGTVETNGRDAFNAKVDYVHSKTYSNVCFANSWTMNHIIGVENDTSYPNTTWNPSLNASNLTSDDWYLLESFPVNTTSYSGNSGYETKTDWLVRGQNAISNRDIYGINLAAVGIINNDNSVGQNLFNFLFISSLMWCLEACGSSDTSYASGSAAVKFWSRKNTTDLGDIWINSPTCVVDTIDNDVYWRYVKFAKLKLDFSTSAQLSDIIRFFESNTDVLKLCDSSSIPSTPESAINIFNYSFAGRRLAQQVDPNGIVSELQPLLARNSIGWWNPIGNSTTLPLANGIAAPTGTGTATARTVATTNLFTSTRRIGYVSSTSAGNSCGARLAALQFWRGNSAGLGGFFFVMRFGISDASSVANARMFAGMIGSSSAIGNVEPTTLTNVIGVGCNAGVTNLSVIYNDGSGTAPTIDLGSNFPTNTLSTDLYELILFCAPNSSGISYRLERVNTGNIATGTLTSDIPANTQLLAPQLWRNNGSTVSAVGIDLVSFYIESNN